MSPKRPRPRLLSVTIHRDVDTDPDTSWIGKYTDDISNPWHILRATGSYIADLVCRCRYCPACDAETVCVKCDQCARCGQHAPSCPGCQGHFELPARGREYRAFAPYAGGEKPGTDDYRKYGLQDFERMEALERGEWGFVGVYATAEVRMPSGTVQRIRSGGLWRIESDSDASYFSEVEENELATLADDLAAIGITRAAFNRAERKRSDG